MSRNLHLVVIDPQHDFCDPSGSLFVAGADADMRRLAAFIDRHRDAIVDITVTLDAHHAVDVAHPTFWRDATGEHPRPFTIITAADVRDGKWTPTRDDLRERMIGYVAALDAGGRFPLCVWPEHCLIGSVGQTVVPELLDQINAWARARLKAATFITKGTNTLTEHYSAVKAEVPDPDDPATQPNLAFVRALESADEVIVAGEAGSHCLANTVRDIADHFEDEASIAKLVLLEDATSPVTGAIDFTDAQRRFVADLTARGMRVTTTADY